MNSPKENNSQRYLTILFLLSLFLMCLTKIVDTDAWLHLSVGRELFNHWGFPETETLTYPSADRPFGYSSWLFGLIYYIAYYLFNVYGVILLKAITITAGFYFLLKDALLPHRNRLVAIIVLTVTVFMARHRFVIRPDTFLMVFLPFSIYALNAFIYENKKYIYALPFIHILWANSHASINLTFVPFLSFIGGGILQQLLNKTVHRLKKKKSDSQQTTINGQRSTMNGVLFSCTPSKSQIKTITIIFILSLAVSLINPHFIKIFTGSAKVIASDWFQHEIVELAKPTWKSNRWPFVMTAVVAVSFILNWLLAAWRWLTSKRSQFTVIRLPLTVNGQRTTDNGHRSTVNVLLPSLIHLLIVLPFIGLSFIALRFIFLLGIVSAPIVARNISQFIAHGSWLMAHGKNKKTEKKAHGSKLAVQILAALAAIWIISYTTLALLKVEPFGRGDREFGFGFNNSGMPEGSLEYMDRRGINGRIFNIFHWGQYIAWRDFPERSAFVDGRGYLTPDLLEALGLARAKPPVLDELYERYGFESIMLNYPRDLSGVSELHYDRDLSLAHPDWILVYWDDISLVYLKKGGKYDHIVQKDGYLLAKPVNNIKGSRARLHDKEYREGLEREFKRNIEETGSSKAYASLGFIYNETDRYREAIEVFKKVEEKSRRGNSIIYSGIAYANARLGNIDESIKYYKKAFKLKEDAATLYNIAIAYLKKGDEENALEFLSEALELNSSLTSIYSRLIPLYRKYGMQEEAEKTARMYEEAKVQAEGEEHFRKALKLFFDEKNYLAAEEYKKSIKASPLHPQPYSNLGYIYSDMDMLDMAYEYQRRALDVDPNFANAHYGLALISKEWGDLQSARRHFQEYIRIEPVGYFSRKAKEEIRALK